MTKYWKERSIEKQWNYWNRIIVWGHNFTARSILFFTYYLPSECKHRVWKFQFRKDAQHINSENSKHQVCDYVLRPTASYSGVVFLCRAAAWFKENDWIDGVQTTNFCHRRHSNSNTNESQGTLCRDRWIRDIIDSRRNGIIYKTPRDGKQRNCAR